MAAAELVAALLMLVVGGAADMASSAFRNAMIMTAATDEVRGRLQGVFIVVVAGGPRIADVVHGSAPPWWVRARPRPVVACW